MTRYCILKHGHLFVWLVAYSFLSSESIPGRANPNVKKFEIVTKLCPCKNLQELV